VPASIGIISVFSSQKDARNIKQGFAPRHENVHFVREESEQYQQPTFPSDAKAPTEFRKAIKADGDINKVALDPKVPNKAVCLGTKTSPEE
jgi:hypothetical protein